MATATNHPRTVTRRRSPGLCIKALASYLGHADPGFTLRIYTHLLPASEDRTRRAIDRAFGETSPPGGGPTTNDGLATA